MSNQRLCIAYTAIGIAVAMMPFSAMAKDYYIAGLEPDNSIATLIDVATITPIDAETKYASIITIFEGDKIKDGTKTAVTGRHFNCTTQKTALATFLSVDKDYLPVVTFINPADRYEWEAIESGSASDQQYQFVCKRTAEMERRIMKFESFPHMIFTFDDAYQQKANAN